MIYFTFTLAKKKETSPTEMCLGNIEQKLKRYNKINYFRLKFGTNHRASDD